MTNGFSVFEWRPGNMIDDEYYVQDAVDTDDDD